MRTATALVALLALLAAPAAPQDARAPITFQDVTKKAGIRFKLETDMRRGRMISTMNGGVAMGDYDLDGRLDLFFSGSAASGKKPLKGPCGVLYRNLGNGAFEDATAKAGIRSCGWAMGAHFVDIDSDGRPDLVVTGLGPATTFWKNRGDGTFEELGKEHGLVPERFAIGLAAGDVNGDGRVDLYVVNYLDTTYEKEMSFPQLQVRIPDDYEGQDAYLYLQREDGTFEDTTQRSGAPNHGGKGIAAVFFDFDADGIDDLYVTNDRVPNVLYRGKGDGTFEDVTAETGAGARDMKAARAGMGVAMGDADEDGRPDLLVTNFAAEQDVYRNVEGQLFDDATELAGLGAPSWPYVQWGTDFADLDDDGRLDIPVVSGHLVPKILLSLAKLFRKGGLGINAEGDQSYRQPAQVYRNEGGGHFADVTAASGDLAKLRLAARGLAAGDLDGDGRIDLAIAAISGGVHVMKNTTATSASWLEILPVATDGRTALGTKVIVTAGGRRQIREFVLRPSYASGAWVPLHFGLGSAAKADLVEVIPPRATAVAHRFHDVPAGRVYTLKAGSLEPLEPRAGAGR